MMRLFCHFLIFCLFGSAYAQISTQCTGILVRAEEAFEQGRLLYILDQNANDDFYQCLNNGGFTREQEIRVHKLLTKAYQFTDNELEAENSFVNLLSIDKEHILSPQDPAELYFLYSKFRIEPIFRVSWKVASNVSIPTVLQSFQEKKYNAQGDNTSYGINLWGEALIERYLTKGLELGTGITYWSILYQMEATRGENSLIYTASNRSTHLRVPILVKYNFNYAKKNEKGQRVRSLPYIFLGASYDYLLSAKYINTTREGGQRFSIDPNADYADLKSLNQVNPTNFSVFIGAGAKFRVGKSSVNFITVELRYDNQIFNYVNPYNRYLNQIIVENIGLIEDDLALNALSFTLGYTHSVHITKKKKKYR